MPTITPAFRSVIGRYICRLILPKSQLTHPLPPTDQVIPGKLYRVLVHDIGGNVECEIDSSPKEQQTVAQYARRCQLIASIRVYRAGKDKSPDSPASIESLLRLSLTEFEKQWLYSTTPGLGPIFGFKIPQGLAEIAGVSVSIRPETLGKSDRDSI